MVKKEKRTITGEAGEEFNTEIKVFCHRCKKELRSTNKEVRSLLDSILGSTAFWNKKDPENENEEAGPKSCLHAMYLDQGAAAGLRMQPVGRDIAQCLKCELKSNIWVCLQCGHLGCGRPNHVRSGGTSHAVEHFEETGHCIAAELGTIQPDGRASVHCYRCNC